VRQTDAEGVFLLASGLSKSLIYQQSWYRLGSSPAKGPQMSNQSKTPFPAPAWFFPAVRGKTLTQITHIVLEFREAVRACAMCLISGFKVPLLFFGVFYLYPLLFVVYSIYTRICNIVTYPFVLWRDQGQPEIISFILSRWCDLANEYAYRFDFNISRCSCYGFQKRASSQGQKRSSSQEAWWKGNEW